MNNKLKKNKKYLGIDYGKSKIGLAVADSEVSIAFSYGVLKNDDNFFNELFKIIEAEGIMKVIIGRSSYFLSTSKSFDAERIGEAILKKIGIEVEYQEEMFSTKIAEINLKEKGAKKIKELDNQEAARVILQSWLDKQ